MTYRLLFLSLSLFFLLSIDSKSQNESEAWFLYTEGAKSKFGHYNKRQKITGYSIYKVEKVEKTDSLHTIFLNVKFLDPKENLINEKDFILHNDDGEITLPSSYIASYDFPEISFENHSDLYIKDYIIPSFLGNGMNLSSAYIEGELEEIKYFKITDFARVVNNFENIETAIGEVQTCVISSKREIFANENEVFTVFTYYTKGIGPVRTKYYDQKRKLVKYYEILELSVPEKS